MPLWLSILPRSVPLRSPNVADALPAADRPAL